MKISRKLFFIIALFLPGIMPSLTAQQTPYFPVSYRIFNPFVFNPAIAGSKDFASADISMSFFGNSSSQLAAGNMRLAKLQKEYFSSVAIPKYTNFGVGGYLFNDVNGPSRNVGLGGTGSYHLQLDEESLSFLSFGLSLKAFYNDYSGDPDLGIPSEQSFIPNIDAGVYYYNADFYAGLSATNILGNPVEVDSLGRYSIPVSREYFLQAGYKFVISRTKNLLIEPFLIVAANDSLSGNIADFFKPGVKFYSGNICIGTYFNDFDKISFFAQLKYDKFYLGTYFEAPYKSAFYKDPIIAEIMFGVNLSSIKTGHSRRNHW